MTIGTSQELKIIKAIFITSKVIDDENEKKIEKTIARSYITWFNVVMTT